MSKNQQEPQEPMSIPIKSPMGRRWYLEGFRFAVNYLHAKMLEPRAPGDPTDDIIDPNIFRLFVSRRVGEGVDDAYFTTHRFFSDNNEYPDGQCPGTPGHCADCPRGTSPLRRRPRP
jgi:hypothetical protein